MCLLPFWGLAAPGGREKGKWNFRYYGNQRGIFAFWRFLAISQQRVDGSTPNFICIGTMSANVPLSPLRSIGPWGRGSQKLQKWGGGLIRAADSYHFYFPQRCQMWFNMEGTDLRTFWCRTVKIGQGVSTGWVKKFEKISNFSPFRHFTSLYLWKYKK